LDTKFANLIANQLLIFLVVFTLETVSKT